MNLVMDDMLAALAGVPISTDTRTLRPGDAFVALRGERFDGHAFVREALAAGASALVVADAAALPSDAKAFLVEDTTKAYMALAAEARRRLKARVVAVTGSAGKTTTKTLIAQLAERARLGKVAATPANENNEIGVSKLFLGMQPDVDVVVVELGARHYGDIAPLVRIAQPDVAVLTNIGEAHLEIMGSRERLIETKLGIFSGEAQPLLNLFDIASRERASSLKRKPNWFGYCPTMGAHEPHMSDGRVSVLFGRELLVVEEAGRRRAWPLRLELPGDHNLNNLAAAIAAALELGVEPELLVEAAAGLSLPPGRYERSPLGPCEIIFDAYNASMSGTIATLRSFSHEAAARRIAVLGGMAELGEESPSMHERVGEAAAHYGVHTLLVGGRYVEDFERGARAGGLPPERVVRFGRNDEAASFLRDFLREGDLVLFKGSRMYRLEEIVDALRAAYGESERGIAHGA